MKTNLENNIEIFLHLGSESQIIKEMGWFLRMEPKITVDSNLVQRIKRARWIPNELDRLKTMDINLVKEMMLSDVFSCLINGNQGYYEIVVNKNEKIKGVTVSGIMNSITKPVKNIPIDALDHTIELHMRKNFPDQKCLIFYKDEYTRPEDIDLKNVEFVECPHFNVKSNLFPELMEDKVIVVCESDIEILSNRELVFKEEFKKKKTLTEYSLEAVFGININNPEKQLILNIAK